LTNIFIQGRLLVAKKGGKCENEAMEQTSGNLYDGCHDDL